MITLKICMLFLSDRTDLSDLSVLKNPNGVLHFGIKGVRFFVDQDRRFDDVLKL